VTLTDLFARIVAGFAMSIVLSGCLAGISEAGEESNVWKGIVLGAVVIACLGGVIIVATVR
jgi:hypothetical protein